MTSSRHGHRHTYLLLAAALAALILFLPGCDGDGGGAPSGLAMEADDCLPGEYYDEEDEACYLELDCETEEECARLEEELYGDIEGLDEELTAGSQQFSDVTGIQETTLVSYTVSGDEIVSPVPAGVAPELEKLQEDSERHEELWGYFVSFVPGSYRGHISGFDIFTDGEDEALAAVYQDESNPERWILAVDIVDAYDGDELDEEDFTYSLIHEFGHLLTLNADQVPPDPDLAGTVSDDEYFAVYDRNSRACLPDYYTFEGCSKGDSYINEFYQQFWADIYDEYDEIQFIEDDEEYWEATDGFYRKYADRFVNDYAATNPGEDIAESFTNFVLRDRPRDGSVSDQKIEFFYDYPELVKLRKFIRSRLG